jgi:hypothetical protein
VSDIGSTALDFVERLERGDVESVCVSYAGSLPQRLVDWLRRGEWPGFMDGAAGPDRGIVEVVSEPLVGKVAVVFDGARRRVAVRVQFNETGQPSGFGLAEWPLESAFRNIVIGSPEGEIRFRMQKLYSELLGLEPGTLQRPVLNLRGGWSETRRPRWPDPNYPQQLHLDLFVADLEASDRIARRSGATMLQDADDHRTYADPAGHPFCLYPDSAVERGVIGRVVIDCFSPRALAGFYAGFLDMHSVQDSPERVVLAYSNGRLPMLGFQHVPRYLAPRWPDPDYPEQIHLDFHFENVDDARARAQRLGAIPLPKEGGSCPVYADPAGHPFCLCSPGQ